MTIGIDISQTAYEGTGVAKLLTKLVNKLAEVDKQNKYILFYSSLRKNPPALKLGSNFKLRSFKFPPSFLNIIWNSFHIFPIERFIGDMDIFITSDWTEPPSKKSKKATIIYDLIVYKYPAETDKKIVNVQKRKLGWVKKESDLIFTISESSKKDIEDILEIPSNKIKVIYPGI